MADQYKGDKASVFARLNPRERAQIIAGTRQAYQDAYGDHGGTVEGNKIASDNVLAFACHQLARNGTQHDKLGTDLAKSVVALYCVGASVDVRYEDIRASQEISGEHVLAALDEAHANKLHHDVEYTLGQGGLPSEEAHQQTNRLLALAADEVAGKTLPQQSEMLMEAIATEVQNQINKGALHKAEPQQPSRWERIGAAFESVAEKSEALEEAKPTASAPDAREPIGRQTAALAERRAQKVETDKGRG